MDIDTAAELVGVCIGLVIAFGKIQVLVVPLGLVGTSGRATDGWIQQTRSLEQKVAGRLGGETPAGLTCQEPVFRIGHSQFGAGRRALAVGPAGEDETDHMAQVPAVIHQFQCQVIKQFGMRRGLTLGAQVLQRGGKSGTEKQGPDAVHLDTGRQQAGSLGIAQPFSQTQPCERLLQVN